MLLHSSEPDFYLLNKGQKTKQTQKDKDASANIWDEFTERSREHQNEWITHLRMKYNSCNCGWVERSTLQTSHPEDIRAAL